MVFITTPARWHSFTFVAMLNLQTLILAATAAKAVPGFPASDPDHCPGSVTIRNAEVNDYVVDEFLGVALAYRQLPGIWRSVFHALHHPRQIQLAGGRHSRRSFSRFRAGTSTGIFGQGRHRLNFV